MPGARPRSPARRARSPHRRAQNSGVRPRQPRGAVSAPPNSEPVKRSLVSELSGDPRCTSEVFLLVSFHFKALEAEVPGTEPILGQGETRPAPGKAAPPPPVTSFGISVRGLPYLGPLAVRLRPPPDLLHGPPAGVLVGPGHEDRPDVPDQSCRRRGGREARTAPTAEGAGKRRTPQMPEGRTPGWVGFTADHKGVRRSPKLPVTTLSTHGDKPGGGQEEAGQPGASATMLPGEGWGPWAQVRRPRAGGSCAG